MNEQIKELAEQVGFGWDDKYHWYVSSLEMERFAELIVQECAEISEKYASGSMPLSIAIAIKKHFGVE